MEGASKAEKGSLKKTLSHMFRSSLSSTCGLTTRNISDAVEPPIFVSSLRYHYQDMEKLHSSVDQHASLPNPHPPVSVDCHSCRPTKPKRTPGAGAEQKTRQRHKKVLTKKNGKLLSNSYGFTSCSSDSDGVSFSSEEDGADRHLNKESETLFSSKSFSSDSSEFYNSSSKRKSKSNSRSSRGRRPLRGTQELLNDGVVPKMARNKGTAVVKQSSDPYADFRSSVMEMVVENSIEGAKELEQLLRSYLSLNSRCHHPIILQVFSDVWETLFHN